MQNVQRSREHSSLQSLGTGAMPVPGSDAAVEGLDLLE